MATLTSRTTGTNTPVDLTYKWSNYFNSGEWYGTSAEATNSNYSGMMWTDVALVLTKTLPTSGEFRISAITLKSVNFTGLGTTYKLMIGGSEFLDKNVMLLNSESKIYLVREGSQLLIVKLNANGVSFPAGYTVVTPVTLSTDPAKLVKNDNGAQKTLNISSVDGRQLEVNLVIKKSNITDNLILSLPLDPDGTDYIAPTEEVIFTDFS